ncbi:lachrymatory-factor synthase-like [Miscanthus floridulus]|uniref:lachrymatory-factor synthase-like n=1 Tax=Miscanthus floridulus TaxID=154761 RepID=UPI0034594805
MDGQATGKWRGTASGVVSAPVDRVWELVSATSRLREWMPMVESCTAVAGDEGVPGYVRLVRGGLMFPQQLQQQASSSWVRERLVAMDHASRSYTYLMEDSNVGLAGSRNTISLFDYGGDGGATLVVWSFEMEPVDGANQDALLDYLRILYKSCIDTIPASACC